jgi:hypothetical protein
VRDLLILGVGVHALEMVEIVERVNRVAASWNLLGYLAADESHPAEPQNGYPVLGTLEQLSRYADACLVPAFGWPVSQLVPRERLVSLIDPTCFVSRTATIGAGSVLYPGCFVGLNARIGDFVFCLSGCKINHDTVLEDRVTLASGHPGRLHPRGGGLLSRAGVRGARGTADQPRQHDRDGRGGGEGCPA